MTIHLSGRGVTVSPALRRRVETKVAKASRLLAKITEVRVVLTRERYRHLAEVTLQAKGRTLRAEAAASDFHAALDVALENLEQQVRRRKDRIRARKPRPPRRARATATEASPLEEASAPRNLVVRPISGKPMSLEEALEQMRVRQDSLLVFTNAKSRVVNVLHRLADGALELVEPGR